MDLCLTSINTRGIRNFQKFGKLCQRLRTHGRGGSDIVFIQETYIHDDRSRDECKKIWGGEIRCAYGDPEVFNSRGVAILIKKHLKHEIINEFTDRKGRILVLDVDIADNKLRLVNIYAPNNPKERIYFFRELPEYLAEGRTLIVAGDTNLISTDSDKNIPIDTSNKGSFFAGNELLQDLCKDFYLSDAYRKRIT